MVSFTQFWQSLSRHPLWLGSLAIGLLTLAMLWRIIRHEQQMRRWQSAHQPTEPASPIAAQEKVAEQAKVDNTAEEAALLLVSASLEQLSLQSYEEMQQPEQADICLVDVNVHLSNLGSRALQVLELHLWSGTDTVVLDIPNLLAAESSVELNQRFRHTAESFQRCGVRYSRFAAHASVSPLATEASEQQKFYQLDCPIVWQAAQAQHRFDIQAQRIAVLETHLPVHAEARLETTPAKEATIADLSDRQEVQEVQETPDISPITHLLLEDTPPTNPAHAEAAPKSEPKSEGVYPLSPPLPEDQTLSKVLEQWFSDKPQQDDFDRDSLNLENLRLPANYKRNWSHPKTQVKGHFPKHF